MIQLRFAVAPADAPLDAPEVLETIWADLSLLSEQERKELVCRKRGLDIFELCWSDLIDGRRFSRSELVPGSRRIRATAATLQALTEAIQANADAIARVPFRTYQNFCGRLVHVD